jgi:hypothetical protein
VINSGAVRVGPSLAVVLLALAGATAGMSLGGTQKPSAGRCEDRLVDTLSVQMSGGGATSKPLEIGETYKVFLEGRVEEQTPLLKVNGVFPGWKSPQSRPAIVVTSSPGGLAYGVGLQALSYAGSAQALAGVNQTGTCRVPPAGNWGTLPGGTSLTFEPFTQAGVSDTRVLRVRIYQSVWVTGSTPTRSTTTTTAPHVRYVFAFFGARKETINATQRRWIAVYGNGVVSAERAFGRGSASGAFVYTDHGIEDTRLGSASFRIVSAASPPSEQELMLNAEITKTGGHCVKPGARFVLTVTRAHISFGEAASCLTPGDDAPTLFAVRIARVES